MTSNQANATEHKAKFEISFSQDSSGTWNLNIERQGHSLSNLMACLLANGKEGMNFKGLVQDAKPDGDGKPKIVDELLFNVRGGPLSAVTDNGYTAFAFGQDYAKTWAVTNRPLKINELFEVILKGQLVNPDPQNKQVSTKFLFHLGVTALNPASFAESNHKRPNGWYWSGTQIYQNEMAVKSYGKGMPKIGDRVGLLQDTSGKLHFFVNGEDQGEYSEKLPFILYGCIQFNQVFSTATIMDADVTYGCLLKINAEK